MEVILLGMVEGEVGVRYRVYNRNEGRYIDVSQEQLSDAKDKIQCENFTITNKNKIKNKCGKLKLSICKNGQMVTEFYTLIGIDSTTNLLHLISFNGEVYRVGINEYIETIRNNGINNEHIIKGELIIREIMSGERIRVGVTSGAIGTEGTIGTEGVIGTQDSSVGTTGVNVPEAMDKFKLYSDIIYNMYPLDRITISKAIFNRFNHVIIKVLDSNMSESKRTVFCKIYKGKSRDKCTFALVSFDDTSEICTVQVAGQSDIVEKSMGCDIEKFYMTYTSWLRESKFTRINI